MQDALFQNKRCYKSILEFRNHLHPYTFHVQGCLSSEGLLVYSKDPHNSVWPLGMSDQLSNSYFLVKLSRWNNIKYINREVLSCIANKYFSQQHVQRISHLSTQRSKFRVQPPQLNIKQKFQRSSCIVRSKILIANLICYTRIHQNMGEKSGALLKHQLMKVYRMNWITNTQLWKRHYTSWLTIQIPKPEKHNTFHRVVKSTKISFCRKQKTLLSKSLKYNHYKSKNWIRNLGFEAKAVITYITTREQECARHQVDRNIKNAYTLCNNSIIIIINWQRQKKNLQTKMGW